MSVEDNIATKADKYFVAFLKAVSRCRGLEPTIIMRPNGFNVTPCEPTNVERIVDELVTACKLIYGERLQVKDMRVEGASHP